MKRTSQQEQEAMVAFFQSSGLSQRAFCERENLKLATFSYWYRKFGKGADPVSGFVEVAAPVQARGIEVVFPNGVVLRGIEDLSVLRQVICW